MEISLKSGISQTPALFCLNFPELRILKNGRILTTETHENELTFSFQTPA